MAWQGSLLLSQCRSLSERRCGREDAWGQWTPVAHHSLTLGPRLPHQVMNGRDLKICKVGCD